MADLLKGDTPSIIAENVRTLKGQGYSESAAVARANTFAGDDETEDEPSDEARSDSTVAESRPATRQFVVVTKDFSGLGWASTLQAEGEHVTVAVKFAEETDPKLKPYMRQVGEGWLDVVELSEAVKSLQSDNTYWIFAENNFPDDADRLREQGQKVFGTSAFSEKCEHDRQYMIDAASKAGLDSMPSHEFNTQEEGLSFLDTNLDKAYVFKPDDGKYNFMTFVPIRKKDADANREVYEYLKHMKEDIGTYILQERIPIEDSLEVKFGGAQCYIFLRYVQILKIYLTMVYMEYSQMRTQH